MGSGGKKMMRDLSMRISMEESLTNRSAKMEVTVSFKKRMEMQVMSEKGRRGLERIVVGCGSLPDGQAFHRNYAVWRWRGALRTGHGERDKYWS